MLAHTPLDGQTLVCLALARHAQGKAGLAALESASRALPDDAEVHYLLGQALEEEGLLTRAAASLARATALQPDFADAHNDLGRVLLELGRVLAHVGHGVMNALRLAGRILATGSARPEVIMLVPTVHKDEPADAQPADAQPVAPPVVEPAPNLLEAMSHFGRTAPGQMESTQKSALSEREAEVLRWAMDGKTNWEISAILNISERTVKFHVQNAMHKLDASTRSQAVAIAIRQGVIP